MTLECDHSSDETSYFELVPALDSYFFEKYSFAAATYEFYASGYSELAIQDAAIKLLLAEGWVLAGPNDITPLVSTVESDRILQCCAEHFSFSINTVERKWLCADNAPKFQLLNFVQDFRKASEKVEQFFLGHSAKGELVPAITLASGEECFVLMLSDDASFRDDFLPAELKFTKMSKKQLSEHLEDLATQTDAMLLTGYNSKALVTTHPMEIKSFAVF
ncbi:MAG: hypothetical protein AAGD04_01605 [Pseudomonadota bacterium]